LLFVVLVVAAASPANAALHHAQQTTKKNKGQSKQAHTHTHALHALQTLLMQV
jgi:hypothetical protein